MKLTKDFKSQSLILIKYMILVILGQIIFHLIKGDFSWEDTLSSAMWDLVVFLVLELYLYFVPRKAAKHDK